MTWEEYDEYHNRLRRYDEEQREREWQHCHEWYQQHYTWVNGKPVWHD